jgi:Zn-finger nucleic acid-binding protein
MRCPACDDELRPKDDMGIHLHCCPECRGAWLDRRALDTIFRRPAKDKAAPAGPSSGRPAHWTLDVPFYDFG